MRTSETFISIIKMFNRSSSINDVAIATMNFSSILNWFAPNELMSQEFSESVTKSTIENGEDFLNLTGFREAESYSYVYHYDDSSLFEYIKEGLWHTLLKMRLLFYLVWPSETMFASLNKVPRYVAEVSS